jgi:hypothetical protein
MWQFTPEGRWRTEEGVEISGIKARLTVAGAGSSRNIPGTREVERSRIAGRLRESSFEVTLRPRSLAGGTPSLELTGEVSNHSEKPVTVHRLKVRLDSLHFPDDRGVRYRRFYKNGYQSWSESRSFSGRDSEMRSWFTTMNELQDNPHNLPPHRGARRRGKFRSDFFALLGIREGTTLLAGQAAGFNQFLYIRSRLNRIRKPPYLELIYDFGGQQLPGHASFRLDPLVLLSGESPEALQEKFFEEIRDRVLRGGQRWSLAGRERPQVTDARRLLNPPPDGKLSGWGSWYYYFARVGMEDLRRNLRLARRREVGWTYFVLDDGYQKQLGDWLETNEKFPEGLGAVAQEIRDHGFEPGIWLAPFVAGRGSAIYRDHRDWFVRRYGPVRAAWNPHWGNDALYYSLDLSNPEVQAYLRNVITTLTGEHGFRFLKLDFLYGAAARGRVWDPRYSPAERLKVGYDLIREAAGEEVFLLGCGSPLAQGIGRVEAMRVGPDVAPFWFDSVRYYLTRDPHAASTYFAVRSAIHRSVMHRRLWLNDPDCIMLRDGDILMNETERFTLAHVAVLTGALYFLSDRLDLISEEGWQQEERLRSIAARCAAGTVTPVGLMSGPAAEVVLNSAGYLGIFNFRDEERRVSIDLSGLLGERLAGAVALRDVWSGKEYPLPRRQAGSDSRRIEIGTLAVHGSCLLRTVHHPGDSPAP